MLVVKLGEGHYRLYMSDEDINDFKKTLGKKFSPGISEWLDTDISAFEGYKTGTNKIVWTPVIRPDYCINFEIPELAARLDYLFTKC